MLWIRTYIHIEDVVRCSIACLGFFGDCVRGVKLGWRLALEDGDRSLWSLLVGSSLIRLCTSELDSLRVWLNRARDFKSVFNIY